MPRLPRRKRTPDFAAEGLVKGLRGKKRAARLELLEYLYKAGVPLDELRRAVEEERLALLPVELVLAQDAKYTIAELANRSGLDPDYVVEQRRATGLPVADPDERAYSDDDVEAGRRFAAALAAGLPREGMLEAGRMFGQAAAQAAAATRLIGGEAFSRPGDTERDLGLRLAEALSALHPRTIATLQYLYEGHLREQLRNDVIARFDLATGTLAGTSEVAVCFADLVDFTRLGEQLAPEDLGAVATRFSALAADLTREPVSLIKMIGDAAMFVSPEPEPLLDTALRLVDAADAEGEGFPQLKAGVAFGEALYRWGDWYGSPVNLASRVTDVAKPASVLATAGVREAARKGFDWSFAGRRRLKGIPNQVSLYRCERPASAGA
jgi:adenylate cyclase